MPEKYIGIWDDGKTSLSFGKLFDLKEKLIKLMTFTKEQQQALALYLLDIGNVFFGHMNNTNLNTCEKFVEELRAE